jgi:translation initiation factor IF-3
MQANKQKSSQGIINNQIRFPLIKLIDPTGLIENTTSTKGLELAKEKGLDLVLIDVKSDPPVCKIMDFSKFKYQENKKLKEAKKKQAKVVVKEVKLSYRIEEHDYKVRLNNAIKFLKAGFRVKINITFKGREIQHTDLAINILTRMKEELKEYGEVQSPFPKQEGKSIRMLLFPIK